MEADDGDDHVSDRPEPLSNRALTTLLGPGLYLAPGAKFMSTALADLGVSAYFPDVLDSASDLSLHQARRTGRRVHSRLKAVGDPR